MNTKFSIMLFAFAGSTLGLNATEEARLLRFPATNGQEIVFSYAGDLYKVPVSGGDAVRLSSHVGYEMFPRFSPDGKTIAFTGQYDGNTEVYTLPSKGGEPLRITYTPTNKRDDLGDRMGPNNIVMAWTPDGKSIVYRNRISSGFEGKLHTVSKEGGLSQAMPLPEGGFCSYSPDGKEMAYNRVMREFRTWKYYKGGMADDIWIYNPNESSVSNITNNVAQDIIPMWIGEEIFFLSDRDRTMNLFAYNTKTKETSKITNYTDFDIKFPSFHGTTIVFEKGGYIYSLDTRTKQAKQVNISLTSDNVYARTVHKAGAGYLSEASLSSDGKRIVVTARGDVFDVPVSKGAILSLSRTPGANERSAEYSPNSQDIVYISDRSGETELYLQKADGSPVKQLTKGSDTYIRSFYWSPDGKTIIYTDRKNRMNSIDMVSGKVSNIMTDSVGEFDGVAFSPDNQWITYTRTAKNNYSIVYVYNLKTKKEYAITDRWYDSSSPEFSTDGRFLLFTSARDFNPIYSRTEWNHAYTNMHGVYIALLSKETPSPFLIEKKEEKKDTEKGKETETVAATHIDMDGMQNRILKLPLAANYYFNLHSDGKKVYYAVQGSTKVFDLNTQKEETIAEGAYMSVNDKAKKALFLKGKSLYVTNIPSGKQTFSEPIDLTGLTLTIDYPKEWAQIFDEAWRAFRDGFYVENMHGVDWKAMKTKYAALLPYAKTRLDLNYIIGEMIGELNCGHAYVNPGEYVKPERIPMGLLGAEVSRHQSGFFRLEKILQGNSWDKSLRSPLTEPGIKVKKGDYIVAIDGVSTNSVKDMYQLLVGKANIPTELSINSNPSAEGAQKITILPLDDEYALYHYQWVQENIRKVEKASNGKIGYIYVPDMGVGGLIEFTKHFYPQLDKEGLIIDDRANGGGNVSPMLLERLGREAYSLTMRRGSKQISTVPDAVHTGPKVCLVNKYSASDGDLFPWRFKKLGLGKVIGTRTWGGIVGISGSLPYMDGTDIRVPFFTNYDPATGEWIVENHGVDPDILIDNDPIKEWNGEDQQLNRAIEEVMKDLKNRKEFPSIPAPRVWNK